MRRKIPSLETMEEIQHDHNEALRLAEAYDIEQLFAIDDYTRVINEGC